MTRFVTIKALDGQIHHVNPDQVAFVTPAVAGTRSRLVFGAVQGGLHELTTNMPTDALRALLEGDDAPKTWLQRLRLNDPEAVRMAREIEDRAILQEALNAVFGPPVAPGDLVSGTPARPRKRR